MADRERREFLELELQAVQKLYDGEKARRETVRASLAVPCAVLALVIFSLNVLVGLLLREDAGKLPVALFLLSLVLALVASGCILKAIWRLLRVDYEALDADVFLLDMSPQADVIEADLEDYIDHPDVRQSQAEFVAIQGAIYAYDESIDKLRQSNERNLYLQGRGLKLLIWSVALIIGSILLALLSNAVVTYVNDRETSGDAARLSTGHEAPTLPEPDVEN